MAQDKFLPNGTPSYERVQVIDDQKKFASVFTSLSPFGSCVLMAGPFVALQARPHEADLEVGLGRCWVQLQLGGCLRLTVYRKK